MTDTTQLDAEYEAALADYEAAARRLVPLLEARIAAMVRATYPGADTLHVLGETNGEGAFVVRAQRVAAGGQLLAGWPNTGPGWVGIPGTHWGDFTDEVDPLLDMLGDLVGDRYEGDHEIDLAAVDAAREILEMPDSDGLVVVGGVDVRARVFDPDDEGEFCTVMVSVGPADAIHHDTIVAAVEFRDGGSARMLTWPDGEQAVESPWQDLAMVECPECWPHDDRDCTCSTCDRTGLVPFPGRPADTPKET